MQTVGTIRHGTRDRIPQQNTDKAQEQEIPQIAEKIFSRAKFRHRHGEIWCRHNLARILKYHGEIWYNFVVPNFATPNFAYSKFPPLR